MTPLLIVVSTRKLLSEKRVNEIYTVNGKAFDYMMNPIVLYTGKPYRVYIANILEFDPVNSVHVHGAMFDWYAAGTNKTSDFLTDIVTSAKGDRGIMEFTYAYPATYMFHAHQTLFTDLGWMGLFDKRKPGGDTQNGSHILHTILRHRTILYYSKVIMQVGQLYFVRFNLLL